MPLDDTLKLRTALLMACTILTDGDPEEAAALMEELYDQADKALEILAKDPEGKHKFRRSKKHTN